MKKFLKNLWLIIQSVVGFFLFLLPVLISLIPLLTVSLGYLGPIGFIKLTVEELFQGTGIKKSFAVAGRYYLQVAKELLYMVKNNIL